MSLFQIQIDSQSTKSNGILPKFIELVSSLSWNERKRLKVDGLIAKLQVRLRALAQIIEEAALLALICVSHNDDEIIMIGSLLQELAANGATIIVAVLGADQPHRCEETYRAMEAIGVPREQVFLFDFPDGKLPEHRSEIESVLRVLVSEVKPDLVLTHAKDIHHDHRTMYEAVRRVFHRGGCSILHFATPQTVDSPFMRTVFVRVSDEAAMRKVHELFPLYQSEFERAPDYFESKMHLGFMVKDGIATGSEYAESFEPGLVRLTFCTCGCGRLVLAPNPLRRQPGANGFLWEISGADVSRLVLEPSPGHGLVVAHSQRIQPHR